MQQWLFGCYETHVMRHTYVTLATLVLITFGINNSALSQGNYLDWIGKKLPNISLTSIDGTHVNTRSLEGKGMIINFWSVTCKPCIGEIPDLNRLKSEFKEVVFLAIAPESKGRIIEVINKHPFDFIVMPDGGKVLKTFGFTSFPITLFVDKNGIIKHLEIGAPSIQNPRTGQLESFAYEHYGYSIRKMLGKQ